MDQWNGMIIPIPKYDPTEKPVYDDPTIEEKTRILNYLDVKPWICASCQLTNFGRNLKCAKCRKDRKDA